MGTLALSYISATRGRIAEALWLAWHGIEHDDLYVCSCVCVGRHSACLCTSHCATDAGSASTSLLVQLRLRVGHELPQSRHAPRGWRFARAGTLDYDCNNER